ncbi:MAG: alginate lyase family protein [Planctomycetota bacterium]
MMRTVRTAWRMGPGEVLARVRARRKAIRWAGRLLREAVNVPRQMELPAFGGLAGGPEERRALLGSPSVEAVVGTGERILEGEIPAFDTVTLEYGGAPNWHALPGREGRPVTRSGRMKLKGGEKHGDIRLLWELGRCQHLAVLGRAYALTGERRFLKGWRVHVEDFIIRNGFLSGAHWMNALEVAMRALAWWEATAFFAGDERRLATVRRLVWQSGVYLSALNTFELAPSNHQIGEALGLVVCGCAFRSTSQGEKWAALGWEALERELGRQVFEDGASREQATGYHRFVTELGLRGIVRLPEAGIAPSGEMRRIVGGMCDFLYRAAREDGRLPAFGDDDEARAGRLSEAPARDARRVVSTGAAVFERDDWARWCGSPDEETLWLFGGQARRFFAETVVAAKREAAHFPRSGFTVLRSARTEVFFDAGPQGLEPGCAHGHADALSIEAYLRGRGAIVDAGTFQYDTGYEWRDYFRGVRGHNTVEVDGEDQAKPGTSFQWLATAHAQTEQFEAGRFVQYVRGTLEGRGNRRGPVRHTREIMLTREGMVILFDTLRGTGRHDARFFFHFAPEAGKIEVGFAGGEEKSVVVKAKRFGAMHVCDASWGYTVVEGGGNPVEGWMSGAFLSKRGCATGTLTARFEDAMVLLTILGGKKVSLGEGRADKEDGVAASAPRGGVCVRVVGGRSVQGRKWKGEEAFVGRLGLLCEDRAGKMVYAAVADGREMVSGGKCLWSSSGGSAFAEIGDRSS